LFRTWSQQANDEEAKVDRNMLVRYFNDEGEMPWQNGMISDELLYSVFHLLIIYFAMNIQFLNGVALICLNCCKSSHRTGMVFLKM